MRLIEFFFRLTNRSVTLAVLASPHREQTIQLLIHQFCAREPLCRILGLQIHEIENVFSTQVDYFITQGLSTVAVDRKGDVCGVLTVEDHCSRFAPAPGRMDVTLQIINDLLDSLVLPASLEPTQMGELYYCGLAAVAPGHRLSGVILLMMIFKNYSHLKAKGFRRGYAKVTNARIGIQLEKLNRIFRRNIFTPISEISPANFMVQNKFPLATFRGTISLITWLLPA